MIKILTAGLLLASAATGFAATPYDARIDKILKGTPLIDGHNDWPGRLRGDFAEGWWTADLTADLGTRPRPMHTDIPRLKAGRVGAQFWSVYVPATLSGPAAIKATLDQIDIVRGLAARYPATFEMAYTAADIRRIHKAGRIASLIGVEGGHQIGESLPVLRQFYLLGARYMTLTHSLNNPWADSATDAPVHNGLTAFGKTVIGEMNRLGMLVDLSHVSPKTMADAIDASKAPVIFSHSSVRALNDHPRNVPDDILRRMPANGGVVMVTWVPSFVDPARFKYEQSKGAEQARAKLAFVGQPDRAAAAHKAWEAANSRPVTPLTIVADHIDHVAKIAGHAHVGIGADLDGIPDTPEGLTGVETYPALLAELLRRGWTDAQIAALAGGNALRAMTAAEAVATSLKGTAPTPIEFAPAAPAS